MQSLESLLLELDELKKKIQLKITEPIKQRLIKTMHLNVDDTTFLPLLLVTFGAWLARLCIALIN